MKTLTLALQLMTRIPIRKQYDAGQKDYAVSAIWFFLTASIVGAVMAAVYYAAWWTGIPYLAAFLCVVSASLVTGGLHIDGFADVCDAFFARKSKEKTLEILKDSRMGTYGVIGILFVFAVKTILIGSFRDAGIHTLLLILAAPVCGKVSMVLTAALSAYPREQGLGKAIIDLLPNAVAAGSILICAAVVCLCAGILAGGVAVAASLCAGAIVAAVSKQKIGGATGDVLGASNEVGEMLYLLAVVLL